LLFTKFLLLIIRVYFMKEHRVSSRYAKALTDVALEQSLESKVVEDIEKKS